MNILIGKFGRSLYFTNERTNLAAPNETPVKFFKWLANTYPEHDFYLVGKNDLTNAKTVIDIDNDNDIPKNIHNLWDKCTTTKSKGYEYILKRTEDMKFDFGIFINGPTGCTNIPGFNVKLDDKKTEAIVLQQYAGYCAPIIVLLNKVKVPWLLLTEDPKYAPLRSRDLHNRNYKVMSQYNNTYKRKVVQDDDNPGEIIEHNEVHEYSGIEKIFLLNERKYDFRKYKKNNLMTIIMNEGRGRGKFIEEWILNFEQGKNVKISGKWSDEWTKKYPDNFISVPMKEMEDELCNTKYTFIVPIGRYWTTSKYLKMIHKYGIIPFAHPSYDIQNHSNIPDFLKVKTPEEMWRRIEYLENNKDKYDKLLNELFMQLKDEYYTGDYMKNNLEDFAKELNVKL